MGETFVAFQDVWGKRLEWTMQKENTPGTAISFLMGMGWGAIVPFTVRVFFLSFFNNCLILCALQVAGMKEVKSVQAVEGLGQVFYEVVHMLGADRQPDGALVDALVRQFRFSQL